MESTNLEQSTREQQSPSAMTKSESQTLPVCGYKVSQQTATLIRAYDKLRESMECVRKALMMVYVEDDVMDIMENKYNPKRVELETALFEFIRQSIEERRGEVGSMEI